MAIAAVLAVALVAAGCTMGGAEPAQVEAPTATPQQSAPTLPPEPTDAIAVEAATEESAAGSEEQASALPDQGPIPMGKDYLEASDPTSVNLADGEPKLVEFFAYW